MDFWLFRRLPLLVHHSELLYKLFVHLHRITAHLSYNYEKRKILKYIYEKTSKTSVLTCLVGFNDNFVQLVTNWHIFSISILRCAPRSLPLFLVDVQSSLPWAESWLLLLQTDGRQISRNRVKRGRRQPGQTRRASGTGGADVLSPT